MISANEVIAIIDATSKKDSFANNPFFMSAEKDGWLETIEDGEPKSFVITDYKVYASPISSLTLKKRATLKKTMPELKNAKKRRK